LKTGILVYNKRVVGYRITVENRQFDLEKPVGDSLGLVPTGKHYHLVLLEGVLTTEKESVTGKQVQDISSNPTLQSIIFTGSFNGISANDVILGVEVAKRLCEDLDIGYLTEADYHIMSVQLNGVIQANQGYGLYSLGQQLREAVKDNDLEKLGLVLANTPYSGKQREALLLLRRGITNFLVDMLAQAKHTESMLS
jgi:hypothetical protein